MRLLLLTCLTLAAAGSALAQCPTLTVVGPAGITTPGDDVTFRAELNGVVPKVTYSWSVDKGAIIKGQGTQEITVATTRELAGSAIKATVEVGGLPADCESLFAESAGIESILPVCNFDEWSEMKPNDERGRLDLMFAELSNNPGNIGMLILRVKRGERLDATNSRVQFVLKHVKFRKFDKSRIWFALEVADERSTKLYRIPPGADPPKCDGCLIFRGESL